MDKQLVRKKVINTAVSIALQKTEETGQEYTAVVSEALDQACEELGVERKEFIKIFI